jgi:hypothetical protein
LTAAISFQRRETYIVEPALEDIPVTMRFRILWLSLLLACAFHCVFGDFDASGRWVFPVADSDAIGTLSDFTILRYPAVVPGANWQVLHYFLDQAFGTHVCKLHNVQTGTWSASFLRPFGLPERTKFVADTAGNIWATGPINTKLGVFQLKVSTLSWVSIAVLPTSNVQFTGGFYLWLTSFNALPSGGLAISLWDPNPDPTVGGYLAHCFVSNNDESMWSYTALPSLLWNNNAQNEFNKCEFYIATGDGVCLYFTGMNSQSIVITYFTSASLSWAPLQVASFGDGFYSGVPKEQFSVLKTSDGNKIFVVRAKTIFQHIAGTQTWITLATLQNFNSDGHYAVLAPSPTSSGVIYIPDLPDLRSFDIDSSQSSVLSNFLPIPVDCSVSLPCCVMWMPPRLAFDTSGNGVCVYRANTNCVLYRVRDGLSGNWSFAPSAASNSILLHYSSAVTIPMVYFAGIQQLHTVDLKIATDNSGVFSLQWDEWRDLPSFGFTFPGESFVKT